MNFAKESKRDYCFAGIILFLCLLVIAQYIDFPSRLLHGEIEKFKMGKEGIGGIILFLCFLLIAQHINFFPRLFRKIETFRMGKDGTWEGKSIEEYFLKIKEVAEKELMSRKIWELDFWYPSALLALGFESSHRAFSQRSDLETLINFYDAYLDSNGDFRDPSIIKYWGNVMHGYTLIYLDQNTNRGGKYSKAVRKLFRFVEDHPKSRTDVLPYRARYKEWRLVDTIGMICPFLARYGEVYREPRSTKLAELQIMDYIQNGVDSITGLPYHGHISGQQHSYVGPLGWGRGTGWYLLGLVNSLEYIPPKHDAYERVIFALNKAADSLTKYQRPDGSWASVVITRSDREMSGTALIAYAIERAIQSNILSKDYSELVIKAHESLIRRTTSRGFVMGASGDSSGPNLYSDVRYHFPWVQGPTTALTAFLLGN